MERANSFLEISKNCKQPEGQTCGMVYENQSARIMQVKIAHIW